MTGYGDGMIDAIATSTDFDSVEALMRAGLAEGAAAAETVVPVMRHLLTSEDNSLFGDEILARVRGMLRHLAEQLLERGDEDGERRIVPDRDPGRVAVLSDMLIGHSALVAHLHGLALEWQLTERLHARFGLDHVLSPLLQALIASSDAGTSALAMRFLASQARHCQAQRRMTLPVLELPGDLLHAGLLTMRNEAADHGEDGERAAVAEAHIRAGYDEAATRLGMMSRLVMGMGSGAIAALSITHAGSALFLTALSIGSGMERDMAVLSTHEAQAARLALALRSAGMKTDAVKEQCLALHPDLAFPEGFDQVGADRAAAILAADGGYLGNCP